MIELHLGICYTMYYTLDREQFQLKLFPTINFTQCRAAQGSAMLYFTVKDSAVLHCAVQDSAVLHSTVLDCTVQCCTVQ